MSVRATKVLGQVDLTTTNDTDAYTVAAGKQATISNMVICNYTAVSALVRVHVVKAADAGSGSVNKQRIAYDVPVPANDCIDMQRGITLAAGDVIRVKAGTANALAVNVFGFEE